MFAGINTNLQDFLAFREHSPEMFDRKGRNPEIVFLLKGASLIFAPQFLLSNMCNNCFSNDYSSYNIFMCPQKDTSSDA